MNILSQTVPIQYDTAFSPYPAAAWQAAFADVARKGLTGVEIAVAYPDRVDAGAVLREAERNGLTVTTISTGQICGLEGAFLTSDDKEKRRIAMDAVYGHIRLSEKLSRPPVTIGLLRCGPGIPETQALEDRLSDCLYPLVKDAQERGVTLQIEAINRSEASLFHTTKELVGYLDRLGLPIGLLFDTYHSFLEDGDIPTAVKRASGRITNVHLCDSHRGLPGEGEIDFPAVIRAIKDTGYGGAFALETKCVPTREHVLSHYENAVKQAVKAEVTK